ncbi:helix-turn-helix transcriptional regulator [Allonocardiopsis opalescens]|uniref:Putative ATPase n=1 Tax=Allonocardiopsis opalescens TaxID=1144618 RepID=A0A2T0Q701_9ACTN|nr:LuxR C-terminal-related transcriptional regulator [Allonocardiopsis opalescens]PRX99503.1 putative ATPase [Allonocardiopsis opalescens]
MVIHLPADLSSFVGRAAELESVVQALAGGRLLTLAGPGGCGKTRLAVRAARRASGGGAVWVDLSEESRDEQVVQRVAEALGVPVPRSDPAAAVAALADGPAMVVIDNCEQVRAGAAEFAEAALRRCPGLTVLATSREPLGVAGERVWRVAPMVLAEAVELLLERSGADAADQAARAAARRICERLDRLPLALELTASWAGTLSLPEIAEMLGGGADQLLLDGGRRSAPFRQRTLADSMDWSHRLLTGDERVLLRRLAPFQQFGVDAVRALAGDGQGGGMLRALRGLIDKSLVVCDVSGPRARHRMLAVVAEYALARLREAGEETQARHQHARVQLDLLRALAPLAATDKDRWRERVREFRADLLAAAEWCLAGGDADLGRRLCVAAAWWWHLTGDRAGRRLLRRAAELDPGGDQALQGRVLVSLALVGEVVQPDAETFAAAERAAVLGGQAGDPGTVLLAQQLVAIGLLHSDLAAARELALRTHREAAAAGDAFSRDASGVLVGLVDQLGENHADACEWLERSAVSLLRRGDRGIAATGLAALAVGKSHTGELERAERTAVRAREAAAPLRDFARSGTAAWGLARVVALRGRLDEAEAVMDELQRVIDEASPAPYVPGWSATRARVALWRGAVPQALDWCERERHAVTPDLLLVHAAALRLAGDADASRRRLEQAEAAPTLDGMPHLRAGALAERARLLAPADPAAAAALHRDALRIRLDHGLVLGCVDSLEALAPLAGTPERTGLLLGAADRARRETGYRAGRPVLPEGPEYATALDRGRALPLDQAADRALRGRRAARPVTGWASLTPAERSVAELAVRGLSNPQIAAELFIGRGTVKTHLSHAYAKLGVANRTELARSRPPDRRQQAAGERMRKTPPP